MKHVTVLFLLALYGQFQAQAQAQLPPIPASACDQVNLRLEMAAVHMERAADFRDAGLYTALFGGAITAIAFADNPTSGRVCLALTVGGVYALGLVSNGHDRKAARLLHQ